MIVELIPNDGRKSFYGKAYVEQNGKESTLYSYNTRICTRKADGRIVKHWDGWTVTTGRHIAAFCGLNKKEFMAL